MTNSTTNVDGRIASEHYGPDTPCSQCGERIDEYSPEWTEYCFVHNYERIDPFRERLHELVKKWRDDGPADGPNVTGDPPYWHGVHDCANELEELLDD